MEQDGKYGQEAGKFWINTAGNNNNNNNNAVMNLWV